MTCDDFMSELLHGEPTTASNAAVVAHTQSCRECAAKVKVLLEEEILKAPIGKILFSEMAAEQWLREIRDDPETAYALKEPS